MLGHSTHIGEVAVKMWQEREVKVQERKAHKYKGLPDILGNNLTYLLHLGQVSEHEAPPPPYGRSFQESLRGKNG